MSACPQLSALDRAELREELDAHLANCRVCKSLRDLLRPSTTSSSCDSIEPLLAARYDGGLGPEALGLVERHLVDCSACQAVVATLSPGDRAGDHNTLPSVEPTSYALGLEVARGGMGRILAARDLRIGRQVAVKELLDQAPALAARFEREARVTARLQHPGIVPIYEIGRWPNGTPFYSMRLVEGQTLHESISSAPALSARLALLPAVIAATEAIAFAHGKRIIHRDLTPSNVLVGAYGETVVIDWGLAKDLASVTEEIGQDHAGRDVALTQYGAVLGTATYMPPEQARGETVDERADVYALGAILYHLLAGGPPYRLRGDDLLAEVRNRPPAPLAQLAPGLPPDLISIVEKAMARDRADRYPSALELASELSRFRTGRMVEAHAYTNRERLGRMMRRNRAPIAIGLVAMLVLAAIGAVSVRNVIRSRSEARVSLARLLVHQGAVEMLGRDSDRGLAMLAEASRLGDRSAALGFLVGAILDNIPPPDEVALFCGNEVRSIAIDRAATLIAAACADRLRVWNLHDHRVVLSRDEAAEHVSFGLTGRLLVVHDGKSSVRIHDVVAGLDVARLNHSDVEVATLARDDRSVITTGGGIVRLWNLDTGSLEHEWSGPSPSIAVLAQDGFHLLVGDAAGDATVWDLHADHPQLTVRHGAPLTAVAIRGDGTELVTCGTDRVVRLWEGTKLVRELRGDIASLRSCSLSNNGTLVAALDQSGRFVGWHSATGELWFSYDNVRVADISDDGRRYMTLFNDGEMRVIGAETLSGLGSYNTHGGTTAVFVPGTSTVATGLGDGTIRLWTRTNGALLSDFDWPKTERLLAVDRSGLRAAFQGSAGLVVLRDIASTHAIAIGPVRSPIALSHVLVGTTESGEVVSIDPASGHQFTLPLPRFPRELVTDELGDRIIAAYDDHVSWSWDHRTGARPLAYAVHALVSSDGALAALTTTGFPCVVDGIRCRPIPAVPGSNIVAITRDRIVLSRSCHGALCATVTDADGNHVLELAGLLAAPSLDPDGRFLVASRTRGIEVWKLDDGHRTALVNHELELVHVDRSGTMVIGYNASTHCEELYDVNDGTMIGDEAVTLGNNGAVPAEFAWAPSGDRIVGVSDVITVWKALPTVDLPSLENALEHYVAWRVEDGRLVALRPSLHGRIVRDGVSLAGIVVHLRAPRASDYGAKTVDVPYYEVASTISGNDGEFELDDLSVGLYIIEAAGYEERLVLRPAGANVVIHADAAGAPRKRSPRSQAAESN